MATPIDKPNGFRPIGTVNGSAWIGSVYSRTVAAANATAIFPGDAVTLLADGTVIPSAAGAIVLGIVTSVVIDEDVIATVTQGYLPATTAGVVKVCIGDAIIYEVQEDGVGSQLALTSVGANVDLIAGAGNVNTGLSGYEIDSSTLTAAGSAQFRILEIIDGPQNDVGNVGTRWRVKLNTGESHLGTANGV